MTDELPRKEQVMRWLDTVAKERRLPTLAERTGVRLSWLYKFREGSIDNPGVNQIDALYAAMQAERRQAGMAGTV